MATDGVCSAPAATERKGRSHSEAERKRRQRINAHLATLRTIVPSASRVRIPMRWVHVTVYVERWHGLHDG
jgi:hypothetical protein